MNIRVLPRLAQVSIKSWQWMALARKLYFFLEKFPIRQYLFNNTQIKTGLTDYSFNDTYIKAIHADYSFNDTLRLKLYHWCLNSMNSGFAGVIAP